MEHLDKFIEFLTIGLAEGKNFVLANAPETMKQYLFYSIVYSLGRTFLLLGSGLFLAFYVRSSLWAIAATKEDSYDDADPYDAGGWVALVIGVALVFLSASCASDALKAWLAPNVYLLEWAAEMLRGGK